MADVLGLDFDNPTRLYTSTVSVSDIMQKQTLTRKEEIRQVIPLSPGRQLPLSRPLVMGIINVTPDSFSDGGRCFSCLDAVKRALQMESEGADIVDIGGESTRPGAEPVLVDEETRRVIPVIEDIRKESSIPISVDTYRADTAAAALDAGADIVNDVSALRFDPSIAQLVAAKKAPVVLMHMLGTPRDMQKDPRYENCVEEIAEFFEERIDFALSNGIDKSRIILDPGIGFGKRLSDNIEILSNLGRFKQLGVPLLVGTSRKSFINMLYPVDKPAHERIGGSIASAVTAVLNGANIVRVHDVAETVEALRVTSALKEGV